MRLLLLLCLVALAVATPPASDNGAHPYVGIAYRYVDSLNGYVVCSGSLVNIPALANTGSYVFLTAGQCIAYGSGNGEQFQVTFSQSPGFTRDSNTGQIVEVVTDVSYSGVGYSEYRLDHFQDDAGKNFGFITLNLPSAVATALGSAPAFPAQVGAFSTAFPFPKADYSPLLTVGYGFSDDATHILGDRRDCGIQVAVGISDIIAATLSPQCYLGQSGAPLLADGIIYGVSLLSTVNPKPPLKSKAQYERTDSSDFQDLMARVIPMINPSATAGGGASGN